ncbi:hypothetical protein RGQ13_07330 [Thalassotalea psychrophila]|uniref:DUF4386 domain-containing protein n=1 Tax=Thalassotalea psychrophila TaxID=3065647 RepID=A0ABY9TYX8_9GAMM|nr:hypothetical protein RGQ13_07330 [Colwelliaceae bacterium SQ149]
MNTNSLKLCAWTGPIFVIMFLFGFVALAGFLPPPSPSLNADEIASLYSQNSLMIRSGLVIMMIALALLIPFLAAIAARMRHMNNHSPVLIITFLLSAAATTALLYIIVCAWGVASFRPERLADVTQAFNDFAFIMLIWPVSLIPVSYIALGISILNDNRQQPVFPRWFGFFNFWMALLAYGGALLIFFTHGPFAWNGLIAFWIPAFAFFGWYIVAAIVLIQSVNCEIRNNKIAERN